MRRQLNMRRGIARAKKNAQAAIYAQKDCADNQICAERLRRLINMRKSISLVVEYAQKNCAG